MPKKSIMPKGAEAPATGGVVISPNLKRSKVQIDKDGNEVVPFTKKIVRMADADNYVPTLEERAALAKRPPLEPNKPGVSPLAEIIQAEVTKAIAETIQSMDIGGMVRAAIQEAFKPKQ